MNIPNDLKYTKTHEWVKIEGNLATVGVSSYAQEQLSDIVYVEITPTAGDSVKKDSVIGSLESVKAAADIMMPLSGTVKEVNAALAAAPDKVNSDTYGSAWVLKVEMADPKEVASLMDSAAYEKYCADLAH